MNWARLPFLYAQAFILLRRTIKLCCILKAAQQTKVSWGNSFNKNAKSSS